MNNFKTKVQNMTYNMSRNLQRFMVGRYGPDDLYKFLNYFTWALIIVNIFVRSPICSLLAMLLIVFNMFRFFSKNYTARYRENQNFVKATQKIYSWFKLTKRKWTERKTSRFRKCPNCKKVLRLPNKKGKHTVNCPNCHNPFEVRI